MTRPLTATAALAIVLVAAPSPAQPPPNPDEPKAVRVSGSLRSRVESWSWFQGNANADYTYVGSLLRLSLVGSKKSYGGHVELAVPVLLGLPDDALAPGAQGQLGFGAAYFAANDRATHVASLFPKQAFLELKGLGSGKRQSLVLGRMEVIEGAETTPATTTLAALKRDRIAHRLIGNFGFSHVGRSLDGVRYVANGPALNLTVIGGRPTRGVFQADGWRELQSNVFYGALTGRVARTHAADDWRIFGLVYSDYRRAVLKTDNRSLAARQNDGDSIHVGTIGGHYLGTVDTGVGAIDVLFWAAAQTWSWGQLAHRAVAVAVEAGWQPRAPGALKPWIRAGDNRGSGDDDATDTKHGTFFQVLPTPRVYARFPFFNLMNLDDRFVEAIVRPGRLVVRTDVHWLRLADAHDLWYSGGGAFQPDTFGYSGRPSNGQTGVGTLYDVSADAAVSTHLGLGAYFGAVRGGAVVHTIYPRDASAALGYLELTYRF